MRSARAGIVLKNMMIGSREKIKTFAVLLDGAVSPSPRLLRQLAGCRAVAADGGMRHAAALDLQPELWLGDFDSAESALQEKLRNIPHMCFPREKDKTDGELAIDAALDKGAEKLILCGAFGGDRFDHSLLHINFAIHLAQKNIPCLLTDGITEGYPLVKGAYCFDFPPNTLFSIINYTDITSLSVRGAKWNLENHTLKFGDSIALSNISRAKIHISLQSGYGILLAQPNL